MNSPNTRVSQLHFLLAERGSHAIVKGQFKPLRDSVNDGTTSAFMWEWFTTKPYVDSGEVRFIGSVYSKFLSRASYVVWD